MKIKGLLPTLLKILKIGFREYHDEKLCFINEIVILHTLNPPPPPTHPPPKKKNSVGLMQRFLPKCLRKSC